MALNLNSDKKDSFASKTSKIDSILRKNVMQFFCFGRLRKALSPKSPSPLKTGREKMKKIYTDLKEFCFSVSELSFEES